MFIIFAQKKIIIFLSHEKQLSIKRDINSKLYTILQHLKVMITPAHVDLVTIKFDTIDLSVNYSTTI